MPEGTKAYKTISEVEQLNPGQRLAYLKDQWGMARLSIRGRLEHSGNLWWLNDVTDVEGKKIEYPLATGSRKLDRVYVANQAMDDTSRLHHNLYVTADIEFARENERRKWANPLLIRAIPKSVEIMRHIPTDWVCRLVV